MIFNGTYTITSPNGDHRTLRVRTKRNGPLKGKRVLELLHGPDNTSDYLGIAFVEDEDVKVWRKQRGTMNEKIARMFLVMAVTEDNTPKRIGYELRCSKRCMRCNRLLTHPDSLDTGIGPECATKAVTA